MYNKIVGIGMIIFAALYVVSPVDLMPGPIDDIILLLMTYNRNKRQTS